MFTLGNQQSRTCGGVDRRGFLRIGGLTTFGLSLPKLLAAESAQPSLALEDLDQRGLLATTLVIWMGEFGRTPKVNGQAGRDHWVPTNAICLSGAGIKHGTIVGQTDSHCAYPLGTSHSTHDFAATVSRLLGIDSTKEYLTPDGRPVLINYHGRPIHEVMS